MTKRRPWPNWALSAREDALEIARQIDTLSEVARKALEERNFYKVQLAVVEMQLRANRITGVLLSVAGDRSSICADCPNYVRNEIAVDAEEWEDDDKILPLHGNKKAT